MATNTYHIEIPSDVTGYKKLIEKIDKENDNEGGGSPLAAETSDIKQGAKDMNQAEQLEAKAAELEKQVEALREQRDQLWKKTTLINERGWRKTLEGKYIKKIHQMGNWGYEINSSPRPKRAKKTP